MIVDLHRVRALSNAASPGPWFRMAPPWIDGTAWVGAGNPDPAYATFVCDFVDLDTDPPNDMADAEFIAFARSAMPAMAEELERLRALVEVMDLHTSEWERMARERGDLGLLQVMRQLRAHLSRAAAAAEDDPRGRVEEAR